MKLFRSKNTYRAGGRSFAAFEAVWVGEPFSKCLQSGVPVWEREYQQTLQKCGNNDPIDVLNQAIDATVYLVVKGQEKAQEMANKSTLPETKAHQFTGMFVMLGSLSHVVFAYAPGVATMLKVDADRVCFDTVERIQQSFDNRKAEINPSYADGARAVLSGFQARLFGEK